MLSRARAHVHTHTRTHHEQKEQALMENVQSIRQQLLDTIGNTLKKENDPKNARAIKLLKRILPKGVDINKCCPGGWTILHSSAYHG